jgi:hypothetical protein
MKDDVIGALGVAMIEHRWNAEQTEQKVREFINAHYRQFTRFGRDLARYSCSTAAAPRWRTL